MRLFIERTIELLKTQVKENLYQIEQNQSKIRELFEKHGTAACLNDFEAIYTEIKKLLVENSDFMNMQLTLIAFLEKNKDSSESIDEFDLPSNLSFELATEENVTFDMTVQGELIFDQYHPMFTNEKFFDKLMHYYISIEDYEKCGELMNTRNFSCNTSGSL